MAENDQPSQGIYAPRIDASPDSSPSTASGRKSGTMPSLCDPPHIAVTVITQAKFTCPNCRIVSSQPQVLKFSHRDSFQNQLACTNCRHVIVNLGGCRSSEYSISSGCAAAMSTPLRGSPLSGQKRNDPSGSAKNPRLADLMASDAHHESYQDLPQTRTVAQGPRVEDLNMSAGEEVTTDPLEFSKAPKEAKSRLDVRQKAKGVARFALRQRSRILIRWHRFFQRRRTASGSAEPSKGEVGPLPLLDTSAEPQSSEDHAHICEHIGSCHCHEMVTAGVALDEQLDLENVNHRPQIPHLRRAHDDIFPEALFDSDSVLYPPPILLIDESGSPRSSVQTPPPPQGHYERESRSIELVRELRSIGDSDSAYVSEQHRV